MAPCRLWGNSPAPRPCTPGVRNGSPCPLWWDHHRQGSLGVGWSHGGSLQIDGAGAGRSQQCRGAGAGTVGARPTIEAVLPEPKCLLGARSLVPGAALDTGAT